MQINLALLFGSSVCSFAITTDLVHHYIRVWTLAIEWLKTAQCTVSPHGMTFCWCVEQSCCLFVSHSLVSHVLCCCCCCCFWSGIDQSDESPRYQHVPPSGGCLFVCLLLLLFLTRMTSDRIFLRKFMFDVCMFCFIFVSGQILWIWNNFAVSWLLWDLRFKTFWRNK